MGYRLGIDCDGVLFDFNSAYARVLEKVSGKKCLLRPGEQPTCWDWPTKYGFSKGDDHAAWREIKGDPIFWSGLAPTVEARSATLMLNKLYGAGHDVYFITNRPGIAPHMQTVMALMALGIDMPQVLVTEDKGPVVKGLKLTHFIDDKPDNVFEAKEASSDCSVFMLATNYNKAEQAKAKAKDIVIVATLREFFEALAREENSEGIKSAVLSS